MSNTAAPWAISRKAADILIAAGLGQSVLQSPTFGTGTPRGPALFFPDYGATRIVIAAGFSSTFQAWGELGLALGWLLVLIAATTIVLHRLLRQRSGFLGPCPGRVRRRACRRRSRTLHRRH